MTKVYVVTQGEYSDFSIYGIYSSIDKAKKAYAILSMEPWADVNDILPWELDRNIREITS